jgi:hypothetical protein
VQSGDIQGLLITGFNADGAQLLQRYVDRYHDVQTAALLFARALPLANAKANGTASGTSLFVAAPGQPNAFPVLREEKGQMWLYEYREFLNRLELFTHRALLDIELGKMYRQQQQQQYQQYLQQHQQQQQLSSTGGGGGGGGGYKAGGGHPSSSQAAGGTSGAVDRKTDADRTMYGIPPHSSSPHIFLRCHFCGSSLPIDSMQKHTHAQFLKKQRPIINCCPNCKKPLPRCYVCLLYMGLLNPQLECARETQRRIRMASERAEEDRDRDRDRDKDYYALSSSKWFIWCQRCRHGGHSVCIEQWFKGQKSAGKRTAAAAPAAASDHRDRDRDRSREGPKICGVNGCNCVCWDAVGL